MDCRWLISFPTARRMRVTQARIYRRSASDLTAVMRLPVLSLASLPLLPRWMVDALNLTLQYVHKRTRGFGMGTQMVGVTPPSWRLLLVNDLLAAGPSRANSCTPSNMSAPL